MEDTSDIGAVRDVGCELTFDVTQSSLFALQVAPARSAGSVVWENLEVTRDGEPIPDPVVEIAADFGGRTHLVAASPGPLLFSYASQILVNPPLPPPSDGGSSIGLDAIVALRQSRYCPSDALVGFAAAEFDWTVGSPPSEVSRAVASWVFERLSYSAGSSGPLDSAVDTLLSGTGVCRDFAHLTIALCRALGVPARLASVYAPGLSPMDFHAVVEILVPAGWQVLDPTRLAPRGALVRIATGRDATDVAFVTTVHGMAELVGSRVFASSDGNLPADDHVSPVSLA